MADSRFSSVAAMMGGTGGVAGVPTQNFNASNILGTPIPQVGTNKAQGANVAGSVGQNVPKIQIVLVAVAFIAIGYVAYHFNFEK